MAFCRECNTDWQQAIRSCPVCGVSMDTTDSEGWLVLGYVEDKLSADFAKEVLTSYEIPAVVISKSGFFGTIGLPLNRFYRSASAAFEVSVPAEHAEEAEELLEMALGERWQPKEE